MVVLIADNDAAVNALLTGVLRSRGLTCESVHDGEQALTRIVRGGIAVLVTDLDMPILDGRSLLDRLAAAPVRPRVVVVSGYFGDDVRRAVLATPGVVGFLGKPFDVAEFADLVVRVAREAVAGEASA